MKKIFVDTHCWIALTNPKDQWHSEAHLALDKAKEAKLVTCDEILIEFLTGLSDGGDVLRRKVAKSVHAILTNNQVEVIMQSRDTFLNGFELYKARADKQYSMTDCISMTHMKNLGITEILTHDEHFTQEGFVTLIKAEVS